MAVGFASYEIARSGLTYNERGLDVTGHNITNIKTVGYSRQQAIAQSSFYIINNAKYGYGQVGTGVDVQQTRQVRHKFLDNIYRYENAKADYWSTRSETFDEIDGILGEPINAGLQSLLNQFWDAWQELSKDPSSLTTRSLVRQLGESLSFDLNNMDTQFDLMQMELDAEFVSDIAKLDEMCGRVAELNKIIRNVEITGEAPNDYKDERNLLLDRISSLIDCEIYERDNGMQDVISSGVYLVYQDSAKEIITKLTPESGMFHKAFVVMNDDEPPVHQEMTFGQCKIQGLLESRGVSIELPDVSAVNGPLDPHDPLNTTRTADVMYARSSITNGSPNTMADIVIAIDTSDTSAEDLERIRLNIDSYVDGLYKKGLDFNLKLISYGETASNVKEYTQDTADAFIADVLSLTANGNTANNFGGTDGVLEQLEDIAANSRPEVPSNTVPRFRANANRYALLFTAESIDGDEITGTVSAADAALYAERLNSIGVSLSVVTSNENNNEGDGTTGGAFGWSELTAATGGTAIDYDEIIGNDLTMRDFADVLQDANDFINRSVSDRISRVKAGTQIIPEVRKRVNALVNILCRGINELHRSGKTLEEPPKDGEDFFVPINGKYPLEIGNIAINPKFLDPEGLNYIVSSETGASEDNVIALAIANLRNLPRAISTTVGETTFDDYYRDTIYSVSNQAADTERYLQNQIKVASSLDEMRHSIMDVSLDEELSYMMKFKYGYDAATRVLNVIDDMIETVVTRLGLVGR